MKNQLIEHFWTDYIASSEVALLQNSQMPSRCFVLLDCAVAIYNYTARKIRDKKNSQIAEHVSGNKIQDDYLNKYGKTFANRN